MQSFTPGEVVLFCASASNAVNKWIVHSLSSLTRTLYYLGNKYCYIIYDVLYCISYTFS
jgi:hypothetical protein